MQSVKDPEAITKVAPEEIVIEQLPEVEVKLSILTEPVTVIVEVEAGRSTFLMYKSVPVVSTPPESYKS